MWPRTAATAAKHRPTNPEGSAAIENTLTILMGGERGAAAQGIVYECRQSFRGRAPFESWTARCLKHDITVEFTLKPATIIWTNELRALSSRLEKGYTARLSVEDGALRVKQTLNLETPPTSPLPAATAAVQTSDKSAETQPRGLLKRTFGTTQGAWITAIVNASKAAFYAESVLKSYTVKAQGPQTVILFEFQKNATVELSQIEAFRSGVDPTVHIGLKADGLIAVLPEENTHLAIPPARSNKKKRRTTRASVSAPH